VRPTSFLVGLTLLALAACGGDGGSGTELEPGPTVARFAFTSGSAVAEGEPVDARYTCDGEDVSPRLEWNGVPDQARELAVVIEDPDAPGATFTHWLVYGIDPVVMELSEGVPGEAMTPGPPILRQGENDFGRMGYGGPCPPGGDKHRYVFRLLALDAPVELEARADRGAFDEAVAPHVLAEARLTATYARD
jgi:hypothetical protein